MILLSFFLLLDYHWFDTIVGHLNVVTDLLLEAALNQPRVVASEKDLFALALEEHLLLAFILT